MAGYSNPVVHLAFPELSEPDDPIWVSIRNPKLMGLTELQPKSAITDNEGKPLDNDEARKAMYEVYARLILGWRVYDPSSIEIDQETGEYKGMTRLAHPATPELVAKLPISIITRLSEELRAALNPPSDSANHTTKTLSLLPSQSTKEPGLVALSQPN